MAAVSESLKKSSISVENISKSLLSTRKTVSSVNDSVNNISKIISTNTRIKRELFSTSETIDARRREASKRREMEDQIEASKLSYSPGSAISFASKGQGGPLSRLLGFLGFTFAGWIVENLPTWIFMGKEFISRIQIFGRSMYDMVDNMRSIIQSFGSVLTNSFDAILRLDFNEFSEGSVARSFDELNLAVQGLGDDITETFRLFTTPLNESVETGEQAPGLEEERPETMFPPISQPQGSQPQGSITFTGPETTSSGVLNPQAAYAHLRQLGVSHIHALGILANIEGESSFKIGADETGKGTAGIGLFQYTFPSRKNRFLQAVPDYKTNWKAQINYAIKNDENTPLYLKKQFSTPEEAADDFMRNWENPSKGVYEQRRKTHNQFIKNFKTPTDQSQKPIVTPQTQTSPPPPSPIPSIPVNPMIGDRLGAGRNHGGVDLQVEEGTPLRAISDGTIVDSDFEKNWGNFLVMKDNMGIYHLYGHMQSGYKRGGPVKKGEIIGKVGMTGRTTGPHLHWEAGTGWNRSVITGRFDALNKYSKFAPFNTQPSKDGKTETPAQISALPKAGQPAAAMTPERKGSEVMFIDATQPQAPQVSYPAQQAGPQIQVDQSKMLNNFIKKKLLLDLAYT